MYYCAYLVRGPNNVTHTHSQYNIMTVQQSVLTQRAHHSPLTADLGRRSPLRALLLALTCAYSFLSCAVALTLLDTLYYTQRPYSVASLVRSLVVTPWNNLKYNSNAANLALHGLHPHYTHLVANLPILLGPLAPLCLYGARRAVGATSVGAQTWRLRLTLACVVATGVGVLSVAPHQEARFLLPLLVPLILLAPAPPLRRRCFVAVWLAFNVAMIVVMGVLHQGGVVPSLVLRSASLHAHLVYSNTYAAQASCGVCVQGCWSEPNV